MTQGSPYDHASELMESLKRIAGVPAWRPGPRSGQQRWLATLEIDGEVIPLQLIVDTFPRSPTLRFSISLVLGASIVRLDYWELDRHFNHPVAGQPMPPGVVKGWLEGPHYHGWQENRTLFKGAPPKELEYAVSLPTNIQGFENAFRWFCAENRIDLGSMPVPDLPPRDTLL